MACEPRLSEVFLAGLPKILKVHVANEPSGQWLENSIRFSVGEANGSNAGSGLVLAKLSEVLFVETLRRYINALPPDQIGWLAGARDPIIGQALALLHKEPAHPWTICGSGKARRSITYAACRALPPFPGRVPDSLPGPMAAETGGGDPSVDRGQRRGSRCGSWLWLRSGIQPRVQAGV